MATLDESLAQAIKTDWRTAEITERERAMLTFVEKLTLAPARSSRDDLEPLRAVGFVDQAILQITAIASFFNYVNRIADGIGVGRE